MRKEDALNFHSQGKPGKIEVVPTKPLVSMRDLALAYSPGVAEPCLAIKENKEDAYKYTAKGNLVGVISNGTAVLGLGNIGAQAGKPVMEGKGVLFKKFAGIDVFDIEVDCEDPDEFIRIVRSLEPTFGGINLEDIKAPESFKIEEELKATMTIPVMHDDQHGTAIISGAALINALEIVDKKIGDLKIVIAGAGAAGIACAKFYLSLGAKLENMVMLDRNGVVRKDNTPEDAVRYLFATDKPVQSLDDAIKGADMFLGLASADILKPEHLLKMANDPIVFALANPNPEINYELAVATRPDIIMATGRSDHPNQVNNVLGFPYIFRGALDVRATAINEAMKQAAAAALAELAKEPVPDTVIRAYGSTHLSFGKNYLIPKPLDPRLITTVSVAVAKAAIASGVARKTITDWAAYEQELLQRLGLDNKLINQLSAKAKQNPKRVIFAEADHHKILKAGLIIKDEGIGTPIFLGNVDRIKSLIEEHNLLDLLECQIIDPRKEPELCQKYGQMLYEKRKRKGMTLYDANKAMHDHRVYFGAAMLECGEGDVLISGLTKDYAQTIVPALHMIGVKPGINKVSGMYIIGNKQGTYFFADTTVNVSPNEEELVEIIGLTAEKVKFFGYEPRVACLSYSNFGSNRGEEPSRMGRVAAKARSKFPNLIIDGEIQANIALTPELQQEMFPFSQLADKGANTFIFPNLSSGNIAYKLLHTIGGCDIIGPVLMGMNKPVHILQMGSSVREIVNMVMIGVVEAESC